MSWLRQVIAALDAAPSAVPIFFRDDDAGWADDRLLALLDRFGHHCLAVDVAVIPTELGNPLAEELSARAREAGVRLHQHGYSHANHETTGRKCEFGPSRSTAEQRADIVRGRLTLADAFGDPVELIYTPPWNRCTPETAGVLVDEGFEILSRDNTAARFDRPDLLEVPVNVDWFGKTKGEPWSRAQLAERLAAVIDEGAPVGVMLHHAFTDADELTRIDDLLAIVASHPMARATTISEVAG